MRSIHSSRNWAVQLYNFKLLDRSIFGTLAKMSTLLTQNVKGKMTAITEIEMGGILTGTDLRMCKLCLTCCS